MSEKEFARDGEETSDEEKNNEKGKKRIVDKNKKSTKKGKNQQLEESDSASVDDKNQAPKGEKGHKPKTNSSQKNVEDEDTDNEKIPLLDQPVIVEGTRNRKPVLTAPIKVEVSKSSIEIPHGTGTPLGKIPLINTRLKRLSLHEVKDLHRFVFGKLGNVTNLVNNLQKFNGFTFQKNSDQYNRKLTAINKFQIGFLKSLSYLLDLDFKLRKKDELSKGIVDFLLAPKATQNSLNPQGIQHPKRKATKRDYFEKDIAGVDNVKRKKKKPATKVTADSGKENAANTTDSKSKSTKSKGKKQEENTAETDNEDDSSNTNELKKPAKKRKRNQVIDEEENVVEEPKTKKNRKSSESVNNKSTSDSETEKNSGEELSDEELKDFLKKVLANANLEKTTMKTVYNLISDHYPKYNFNDKKDFIKGVVKSLIQS